MKIKKISWSSVLIGILTFGLLGFSIYNILTRTNVINLEILKYVFLSIGGLFGLYFGVKSPLSTELFSFGITTLIAVQAFWDTSYDIQGGIQDPRVIVGLIAVGIFILNAFTGRFRKGTAKKQLRSLLR